MRQRYGYLTLRGEPAAAWIATLVRRRGTVAQQRTSLWTLEGFPTVFVVPDSVEKEYEAIRQGDPHEMEKQGS